MLNLLVLSTETVVGRKYRMKNHIAIFIFILDPFVLCKKWQHFEDQGDPQRRQDK